MKTGRYVVITPTRNEEKFLGLTIDSVTSQTVLPQRWIIVEDGSGDKTSEIAEMAAAKYDWIKVLRRPDRGSRSPGQGVVEAFYDGYRSIEYSTWDFLVKLDGDLSFGSGYFEKCLERFNND